MNMFRTIALVLSLLLVGLVLGEAQVTIPNTFTAGTTISSSQVNLNFATLGANALNRTGGTMTGGLTTVGITPSADNTYDMGSASFRYANIYGTQFRGGGANITALNGTNISTGTVPQANLGNALLYPVAGGRCSLTSGTAVTTADVTAATTIYFEPYGPWAGFIGLYDGSVAWNIRTFPELSIAVPATTSTMYDLWVFDNAGTPTLEALPWTNDTTRATALTTQNNLYVKTAATTRRYVCSFRTTTVSGQTEDSFAKRYLWNYYNRQRRELRNATETADNWTYSLAVMRQANANPANQLDVVVGVAEVPIEVEAIGNASSDSAADQFIVAIGEDSTSAVKTGTLSVKISAFVALVLGAPRAALRTYPPIGRHTYVWLEYTGAVGTTTWRGDNGTPTLQQSGIHGMIEG